MRIKQTRSLFFRVMVVAVLVFMNAGMICDAASTSSISTLKFVNPTHGAAKIKGEMSTYHYVRTKITADRKSDLSFKEKDCVLIGQEGRSYSKCWIYIAGWSAGLSVSQRAPIMMKTLSVQLSGGKSSASHKWNASMIDGPKGSLDFSIPEGGFVQLYFLWEVPKGFSASSVKIGDYLEIAF